MSCRRDFDDDSWECRLAFDPNTQDVTGQTSLYVSCLLGNTSLISMLLSWKVRYVKVSTIGTVSSVVEELLSFTNIQNAT